MQVYVSHSRRRLTFLAVSAKEASGTDAGVGVAAHVVTRGAIFAFVSKTSRS